MTRNLSHSNPQVTEIILTTDSAAKSYTIFPKQRKLKIDLKKQIELCYELISNVTFHFSFQALQTTLSHLLCSELKIPTYVVLLKKESGYEPILTNVPRFLSSKPNQEIHLHTKKRFNQKRPFYFKAKNNIKIFDAELFNEVFEGTNICTIPLMVRNQHLGYLVINHPETTPFSKDERYFYPVFASHLAASIKNLSLYEETKQLSITDTLTQIPNRRHFHQRLKNEIERAKRYQRPLSLLMLDIDHFKDYNDKYGHIAGDEVLKKIAHALENELRIEDFLARFGGEEFVIILPETNNQQAKFVAEKVRRKIEQMSKSLFGGSIQEGITISIGLASLPEDGALEQELLEKADERLYIAKSLGRNQVC